MPEKSKKKKDITLIQMILGILNMFIGFFIVITGTTLIPQIANVSREGSLVPTFYALSIISGTIYFFLYKQYKYLIENAN
jgi:hypothetical protein